MTSIRSFTLPEAFSAGCYRAFLTNQPEEKRLNRKRRETRGPEELTADTADGTDEGKKIAKAHFLSVPPSGDFTASRVDFSSSPSSSSSSSNVH
jgi:hypothetical protein